MTDSCPRDNSCIDLGFEERILLVLERPRGSCKHCCVISMLHFVILPHSVDRGVRIAIVFGSSLDKSSFISLVRECLSASRQYRTLKCLFVGGHRIFPSSLPREDVDPWPSSKTQSNSGPPCDVMTTVALPIHGFLSSRALPVCINTHSPPLSPICSLLWICSGSILVAANNHMRISFGIAPVYNGRIPA